MRFAAWIIVGLGLFLAVGALVPAAQAYVPVGCCKYVRFDMKEGEYLWGNLTWKDGKGRIVWGPATAENTDAVGGGGDDDAVNELLMRNDQTVKTYTGERPGVRMPPVGEFVSDPVPERLFVNHTRSISVELHVQRNPQATTPPCATSSIYQAATDPWLDVELHAGDKVIGGSYGYFYTYWFHASPTNQRPAPPSGFGTCYFGMAPEVPIIEKGTQLTLKVFHVEQNYYYPYGFGPDHPSTIRIPLYPLDEVLYRYPPEITGIATEEDGSEDALVTESSNRASVHGGVGMVALAAVAGLALPAARRRSLLPLVLALLLAAGLSGCIGSKSTASDRETSEALRGEATVTQIQTAGGLGSILGQVHDDLHIPVGGVHVSILGFPNFTTTDGQGRFSFLGLAPGTYKLRFDKATYSSYELDVEVRAGFVAKPSIMMFLADQKDRDARLHNHDYWTGQPNPKTLLDSALPVACNKAGYTVDYCYAKQVFGPVPKGDDPMIIPPGTVEVEVTLNWKPEEMGGYEQLGLAVKTAQGGLNYSVFAPRAPGTPFRIPVSWETSDRGHQTFSSWTFEYIAPHRFTPSYPEYQSKYYNPPGPMDKLSAKIVIKKGGNLPLEPGHPDHWLDRTSLPIQPNYSPYISYSTYPPSSPAWSAFYGKGPCYLPKIIPQGTRWIEVVFKQSFVPLTDYGWKLMYKPADTPAHAADYQSWEGYKTHPPAQAFDGEKVVWKVPVKENEADFMYARTTVWSIYFTPTDLDQWWVDMQAQRSAKTYTCSVTAHSTPL